MKAAENASRLCNETKATSRAAEDAKKGDTGQESNEKANEIQNMAKTAMEEAKSAIQLNIKVIKELTPHLNSRQKPIAKDLVEKIEKMNPESNLNSRFSISLDSMIVQVKENLNIAEFHLPFLSPNEKSSVKFRKANDGMTASYSQSHRGTESVHPSTRETHENEVSTN